MIEQYKLCGDTSPTTGDGGDGDASQSVNDFTFETLFDIKCLVQKDDPELQRFVFCVLNQFECIIIELRIDCLETCWFTQ